MTANQVGIPFIVSAFKIIAMIKSVLLIGAIAATDQP